MISDIKHKAKLLVDNSNIITDVIKGLIETHSHHSLCGCDYCLKCDEVNAVDKHIEHLWTTFDEYEEIGEYPYHGPLYKRIQDISETYKELKIESTTIKDSALSGYL